MITNEDIHILAEQAKVYANQFEEHWNDGPDTDKIFNQKFAELIVWETFAALWTDECMQSDLALEQFNRNVNNIKKHFGMKE